MDCTNIDGANGNEAPGFKNEPNLLEECAKAVDGAMDAAGRSWVERWTFPGGIYEDAPDFPSKPFADVSSKGLAGSVIDVLRCRGLLTSQALELLQRDGDLTPLPR